MALTLALPTLASAADIRLYGDQVVPVTFDDEISLKENRRGDRFTATVVDDRDLPRGTRFEGRIVDIQQKRDDRPAFVDMEFTSVRLPDGTRANLRAVPIRLDDRYVRRDRDGRFVADRKAIRKENVVIGGAVGGLILGSIFKKPFEGAFIGALAGIVLGETGALNQKTEVAITRGQKVGALIERNATIRYNGDWYGRDDRNGRYDDWDNRNRDRDRDDNWYNDRDDRYRDEWTVRYNNRDLRFARDEQPYRLGDTLMVPLESAARQMDLDIERIGNSRVFFVEDRDSSLRLEQDSTSYRLNGRRGTLPRALVERRGVVFAPLEALALLKPNAVTLNGGRIAIRN